jgi:hypothetical protein
MRKAPAHDAGPSLRDIDAWAPTVDGMKPTNKYRVSAARQKELFDQRAGETPEQMIARQLAMATPFEVAWLAMLRGGDEKQIRALEMLQLARAVWWSRAAIVSSAGGVLVSVLALVVAV